MLLLDTKIGRHEAVIELHDTTPRRWLTVERPSQGEIIIDLGRVSIMLARTTPSCTCKGFKKGTVAIIAAAVLFVHPTAAPTLLLPHISLSATHFADH